LESAKEGNRAKPTVRNCFHVADEQSSRGRLPRGSVRGREIFCYPAEGGSERTFGFKNGSQGRNPCVAETEGWVTGEELPLGGDWQRELLVGGKGTSSFANTQEIERDKARGVILSWCAKGQQQQRSMKRKKKNRENSKCLQGCCLSQR